MADADVSGPPGNLNGGGSSQGGGDAPSVGPGTGMNPDNPARGVTFGGLLGGTTDSSATDSALDGLLGLLGFDPSAPAAGVNVETEEEAPRTHPDEGLFGVQSVSLTDPGYSKAVNKQGKALGYDAAKKQNLLNRQLEYWGKFETKAKSLKEQIDALRQKPNKTQDDYKELSKLSRQYQNVMESDQYQKFQGYNNPALGWGAKALASSLGLGVVGLAPSIERALIQGGWALDTTTPQDVMDADPADDAPEGPSDEGQSTFWSLMNVVRNNRDIFENVSIEKIRELLGDSKKFWEFYETAKAEQTS